jgi:hypothetical protein
MADSGREWRGDDPAASYSTDIRAAWSVIERLISLRPEIEFHLEHFENTWVAGLGGAAEWVRASSAPLVISRAALLAALRTSNAETVRAR